jgi:hypothetical protein
MSLLRTFLLVALASASLGMGGCASEASEDLDETEGEGEVADESAALGALEYDLATDRGFLESGSSSANIDREWGNAFFEKDGDKIWIRDRLLDGVGVGVHWKTSDGRQGICRNTAGHRVLYTKWMRCEKNFPEGSKIWMRMGRCNGSDPGKTCRVLSDYTSWTDFASTSVR